jgi:membrane protein
MRAWNILRRAISEFSDDDAMSLAGALAFYTALSLAPLVLIVIKIAGLLDANAQDHVVAQITGFVGREAGEAVAAIIEGAERNERTGTLAAALGLITLAFSATGVFGQLQMSLNRIWDVRPKPGQGVWLWIRKRILSFGMVLSIAFLLLVSLVISAGLSAVFAQETLAWNAVSLVVSIGLFTALFALMFRYLPDARIGWRDVWTGAATTAVLFAVGKFVIALYLGRSAVGSAYGAAGSLVILLLWVYYSAAVFFFGAEITESYAHENRSPIVPDATAERVPERTGPTPEPRAEPRDRIQPRPQPVVPPRRAGISDRPAAALGLLAGALYFWRRSHRRSRARP